MQVNDNGKLSLQIFHTLGGFLFKRRKVTGLITEILKKIRGEIGFQKLIFDVADAVLPFLSDEGNVAD